jgi:hypothetical protein
LSNAYHPQTDGQSGVLNRIIEDYLRAYSSEDRTAWARLLPLAQFAYNNSRNYTTGMSPNRLLSGFDCNIRMDIATMSLRGGSPLPTTACKNCMSCAKSFVSDWLMHKNVWPVITTLVTCPEPQDQES